jgi:hypothetical protein
VGVQRFGKACSRVYSWGHCPPDTFRPLRVISRGLGFLDDAHGSEIGLEIIMGKISLLPTGAYCINVPQSAKGMIAGKPVGKLLEPG